MSTKSFWVPLLRVHHRVRATQRKEELRDRRFIMILLDSWMQLCLKPSNMPQNFLLFS